MELQLHDTKHIDPKKTDNENYTLSLLAQCSINGILSPQKLMEIRNKINELFKNTATAFTKGNSSSLPVKTSQTLFESVLFACDVFFLSLPDADACVVYLENNSIESAYENGRSLIWKYFQETRVIFRKVYETRLEVKSQEYTDTILKVFDQYYLHYDFKFAPQNIPAAIDYPLLYGNWLGLRGVLYIKKYYTSLMFENQFCRLFKKEELDALLEQHGAKYSVDYSTQLFNICEVVLINALAAAIAHKPLKTLEITKLDCLQLTSEFQLVSEEHAYDAARKAFCGYMQLLDNPALISYLRKYTETFALGFHNSAVNDTMQDFLCVFEIKKAAQENTLSGS
ncbi:MAG: DUF6179 domain-containing protein [Oscillospiraceae bacterium]|nr:DUF6179 domain-containing protein [Oscillospiraceae bacterium]